MRSVSQVSYCKARKNVLKEVVPAAKAVPVATMVEESSSEEVESKAAQQDAEELAAVEVQSAKRVEMLKASQTM